MYRVFRYTEIPKYWPAVATVYVNVSPTIVEEYVTDDKGNPSLVSNKRSVYVYDSLSDFPVVGRTDLLYIAKDTSTQYYWDGSSYVSVTPSFTETDPVWTADKPSYLTSASAASTYAPINHTHTFASLTSKPTTLAGYGITDAYPLSGNPSGFVTGTPWTALGYITSAALSGLVPYSGANAALQLATNNLTFTTGRISFGTNSGTSLINFPDANSSTNGINFGNNVLLYQGTSPLLVCSSSFVIGATSGLVLTSNNIYRNGSGFDFGRYGGGGNISMYANNTTLVQTMFSSTGNVSIGTTSDLARLAVQGNSAVSGLAFLVQNSTPTDLFTVDNTGKIGLRPTNFELWFGTIDNASYANLKQVSGVLTLQAPNNSSTINLNGGIIGDYLTGANVYGVNITNVVNTRTITGTYSLLRLFQYITPTSGISNTNFLEISGTIQQTGGANGITRGILIAPTLTAAYNYIGIESNGRIQIGLPTLNSWSSYAYSGRYVNAGIYLEGANSPIDLRLQATNLSGGNGVIQLFAGNNNNSYLLLGLTYLRESGGNLFIGTTNTAPSATLHARGNSPTANHVFQLENSSTNLLFRVANNGDILFGATGQVLYVGSSGLLRFGVSAVNNYIAGLSGTSNGITISGGGTGFGTRFVRNEITNSTSGTFTGITLEVNGGFQPTSGNASLTMIQVTGQINQTGTSTGITKGININQALTSTIDYRAIEAITGNSPTHTLIKLNNGSTDVFCVKGDKTIIMNIPTSSAGLPSGALWNDSGTLKIV